MDPESNFSMTLLVLSCTAPAPEKKKQKTRKKVANILNNLDLLVS